MSDHSRYISPFSTRYASPEMQFVFSEDNKFRTWRRLWIALARAEQKQGLPITDEQITELEAHKDDINYDDAQRRERECRHDVMSHVYAYGLQCPKARGIIHLGATSCYVGDNTDVILMKQGLEIVRRKVLNVMDLLARFAEKYKALPALAYTHLQPAQLTTVGKRHVLRINRVERHGLASEHAQLHVFLLQRVAQPRSEIVRIEQVAHADARPFVLVGIRWAYSLLGRPDKLASFHGFHRPVEHRMVRHHDRSPVGNVEIILPDTARLQRLQLADDAHRVHHHAVGHHILDVRIEYTRRYALQGEPLPVERNGVTGIVSALITHHHIGVPGIIIGYLSFSLVPPLGSDDNQPLFHRYRSSSESSLIPALR